MSALQILALSAVLVAGLITFTGMWLFIAGLVQQAEADRSLEDLSTNREKESFLVSSSEPSSSS